MTPDLLIRPVRFPDDYAAAAAVLSASNPEWPVTAELLRHEHEHRDPALYFTSLVAERGGHLLAVMGVGHDDFAFEPWRYWANLQVHPDARRQGVGAALYRDFLQIVQERGAREVRTMLSETDAPGLGFLQARGWQETWRRHEFRLHTAHADLTAMPDLGHLRLETLDALTRDPQRDARLHELDWLLFQDVPMGQTLTRRPLEAWVQQELQDPAVRPHLSFVLLDDRRDDPLTGPYVGYTTLGENPGGFHYIGMTGVLREYRGRGLARALKLASMRALQAAGGGEIRTFNDPPNTAMIRMNRALGFQPQPDRLRLELRLGTP
ncbi:GNAT family N-acetyltransferase [Deinococcus aquiradiocola]|uniref:N-acetyltransferase n=1 Tax=Deinococcus aquiradiocola TaxID=393059 RepID=A0A917PLL0_9DEIO|nr:GNAT family N-acetyltransferase [Deinococcus aquiradiocola]GGJ84130.1 N-acetyltransferase [Deinococcus aquiradiocola]